MAEVNDYTGIKYWIAKIDFDAKAGAVQQYRIQYTKYIEGQDDYTQYDSWTTAYNNFQFTSDGYNPTGLKCELTNLDDASTYLVKFTNLLDETKVFCMKFSTGETIAMSDSPYYNKVLNPGQVYDWWGEGYDVIGLPTYPDQCAWYYRVDGHKAVDVTADDWYSLGALTPDSVAGENYFKLEDGDVEFDYFADDEENVINRLYAYYCNKTTDNTDKNLLCLPCAKYNDEEGKFNLGEYYWGNDGGGGVSAGDIFGTMATLVISTEGTGSNVYTNPREVGFAVFLKSYENDSSDKRTLWWVSSRRNGNDNWCYPATDYNIAYNELYVTGDLKLAFRYKNEDDASGTELVSNITFTKDKWYYIVFKRVGEALKVRVACRSLQGEVTMQTHTFEGFAVFDMGHCQYDDNTWIYTYDYAIPLVFGGPTTKGTAFALFWGQEETSLIDTEYTAGAENDLWDKLLNSNGFNPTLKLTDEDGHSYTLNTSFTLVTTFEKASFLIDPDIFTNSELSPDYTGNLTLDMMANGQSIATKVFEGFTYPSDNLASTQKLNVLYDPADYIENDFDLNFAEYDTAEERIKALSRYFFTKHGSWGGYNGGCNGNNLYFNSDKNLVLECHGDKYSGDLKGIGRESWLKGRYTGYGEEVDRSIYDWDTRTNKDCLRSGTALVSNRYFPYGRCDIYMKLPQLTMNHFDFGVSPALWLFHYVELNDTDPRYDKAPYNERNEQGSDEAGFYRVINNEIDMEFPSHLTNGAIGSFDDLADVYFDTGDVDGISKLDTQLHIGVNSDKEGNKKLYRLINASSPYVFASWKDASDKAITDGYDTRVHPTFRALKFNNWQGELLSGNGWCTSQTHDRYGNSFASEGVLRVSARDYYWGTEENGTNPAKDTDKEEYLSQLTEVATNWNGYADNKFHKYSIVWTPTRTVMLIDDVVVRTNRGFIPFTQMKLTMAMWFPTMATVMSIGSSAQGNDTSAIGVLDNDGVYGSSPNIVSPSDDTPIGTWAGISAPWEVLHAEISRVKFERYNIGDTVEFDGVSEVIEAQPLTMGESFPESGLRILTTPK